MKLSGTLSESIGDSPKVDTWVWGDEVVVWGYHPEHQYTLKILRPKIGRAGCLSLQYHHHKSESWFMLSGLAWILVVADGEVCTRIMRANDIQNLPCGSIHRLMGLSEDAQIIEPSTPDRHAADKSVPKDVVRLHCVQGREVETPDPSQKEIVDQCILISDEAIAAVERGEYPIEYNREKLIGFGAYRV